MSAAASCWYSGIMQKCKLHTHALLTLLFVPWVFLLGQQQVGSWDINPTAILSLTAATWKINLAAPPALLSALSPPAACQAPFADYTAFIYPAVDACLPWFHMATAASHREDWAPFTSWCSPYCPILKPIGGPLGIGISGVYGEQQHWHCNGAV